LVINTVMRWCTKVVYNPPLTIVLGTSPKPEVRKLGRGVMEMDQELFLLCKSRKNSCNHIRLLESHQSDRETHQIETDRNRRWIIIDVIDVIDDYDVIDVID